MVFHQPIWKILVKFDHFFRDRGENTKSLKNNHLAVQWAAGRFWLKISRANLSKKHVYCWSSTLDSTQTLHRCNVWLRLLSEFSLYQISGGHVASMSFSILDTPGVSIGPLYIDCTIWELHRKWLHSCVLCHPSRICCWKQQVALKGFDQ